MNEKFTTPGGDMNRRMLLGSAAVVVAGSLGAYALLRTRRSGTRAVAFIGEDSSNLQAISHYLETPGDDFTVHTTVEATDFATYADKAAISFTQGSADYDIIVGYNFDLPRYVQNHYVFDVATLKRKAGSRFDASFEADLLPNVWRELGYFRQNGSREPEAIAYPSSANTMVLVFNEAVFADGAVDRAYRRAFGRSFAPPKTWEEFADVARLVVSANPGFKGVALQGAEGGWLYYEWMNFLFGMGGKVMEKANGWDSNLDTPLTLRTVEAARAAALYLSLKPLNAGDFYSTDATVQRDLMLGGDVAMAIMWTDYIPELAAKGGFGFAPIPGEVSMIAGGSFFVNARTDVPGESAAVIARLLSPGAQKRMALDGLFPPTRSALSDPDVLAKPYMPAVRTSLERGVYMLEAGVDATLISEKITQALQEAWRRDLPGETVGARATELIEAARRPTGQSPVSGGVAH